MQIQEYLDKIKKEQEKTELKTPDFVVESTKAGEERGREGMYGKGLMSPDKQQEKTPPEMDMPPPSSGIENQMAIVRNYLNNEMYVDSPLNQTKLKIQDNNFSKRQAAIDEIARGFSNSYTDAQVAALKATMDAESESSLVEKGYTKARALQVFTNQDADYYPALQALPNNASKEDIFNVVYGGRMGNTEPGDGNKYRGRGVIQITGKNNYREISQRLGLGDLLVDNPDLVATNPDIMIAATKEYLNMKGFGNTELSANSLKDTIGHAGGAAEAEERWEETLQNLRSAGEEDTADDLELNNEFTAQRTAGTTVDGDIGPNSLRAFRAWLTRANIPVPQNATPLQLVRLINANS